MTAEELRQLIPDKNDAAFNNAVYKAPPIYQPTRLQAPENKEDQQDSVFYRTAEQTDNGKPSPSRYQSIHEMSTDEWRAAYEQEGCVDLWVEEEFNSGSRLMVSLTLKITACA